MRAATTILFVSCLLAVCYGQLLPCAPKCRHEDDGALFPNPRDCTKFFQCAYNIAVPHRCPKGLFFNPVILVCDYPDSAGCVQDPEADCSDGKTTTIAATVETTTVVESTVDVTTDAATTDAATTDAATTDAATTDAATTDATTTVEATTDAATTDAATTDAATTDAATTDAATSTATEVEITTIQPTVSTTVQPGSTTVSGECKPECPSAEAMFPNPRDCSTFFKCAFNHPFLMKCPAGQWYDGPNERCDYPELAECNAGPDVPCVAVTNPTEPPQETTTTTDGGDDCVPPCPADEALYPNPRDCGSFYQCAFGVPFLMQCPEGQEYAAALERCDYPEEAECTAGPDTPCVAVTIPPHFVARRR